MWHVVASPPVLALACLAAAVLYTRHIRRDCHLSPFWFIICLITKALRPKAPAKAPPSSGHSPPPHLLQARDSMRRLIRLATPLMSHTPRAAHLLTLRRVDASVAGVSVRWSVMASSCYEKV
jgi:hypothetical protein